MVMLFILIIIAIVGIKFPYFVVVAKVNNTPIFVNEYLGKLNKTAGSQIVDQMVTEALIQQEAKKKGISATSEETDKKIAEIETQFGGKSGFDTLLESRGLTRDDVRKDIALNLILEKLVGDKIVVSDEEVAEYYKTNKDAFKDQTEEEAKTQIKENLKGQKLQQEVGKYIEELKSQAKISIYLPGVQSQLK